jgi:hypothetical protein
MHNPLLVSVICNRVQGCTDTNVIIVIMKTRVVIFGIENAEMILGLDDRMESGRVVAPASW